MGLKFQRTLRFRIVLAAAALSSLIVIAVSIFVVEDARNRAITVLEERAVEQAALIAGALELPRDDAGLAGVANTASGAHVRILDRAGTVVEDSHATGGSVRRPAAGFNLQTTLASGSVLRRGNDLALGGDSVIAERVIESSSEVTGIVLVSLPISQADDSVNGLRATAAIGGLAVVAVATVFAVFLSARLTRSIATVTEGAGRVAAGDLEHRLRPEPPSEVEQLARAVNGMAARLSQLIALEAQERGRIESILATMSDGVIVVDETGTVRLANPAAREMLQTTPDVEIGQRLYSFSSNYTLNDLVIQGTETGQPQEGEVRFLESLRVLRATVVPLPTEQEGSAGQRALLLLTDLTEQQRVETTRREFVSNASHELRTPLTAIQASVETLADGAIDNADTAREFLERMGQDTRRMDALITEMLELSQLERGEDELRLVELDPMDLVHQSVDLMKPLAASRDVAVNVVQGVDVPGFEGDHRRMVEALTNLISNAIKATPQGAEVRVSASEDDGSVAFRVEDEGRGIEPEHFPHIFERFYKGDPSRSDGGAGLGLAIVKHIASAHGGDVSVASEVGEGALFTLKIPTGGKPAADS